MSDTAKAAETTYDLNDLDSDTAHLAHLLDATVDTIMECNFGSLDNCVPHMDRLNALLWIARDMAEQIHRQVETNFGEIGRTTAPKGGAV